MTTISLTLILYPLFAMSVLTFVVMARMARLRFIAIRSGAISIKFFRAYADNSEPEHLRVISRHFTNLFEMPVLFYVVVVLAYVTQHVNVWMVACAWGYVALRYAHSYVHLTSNNILVRAKVYLASAIVLLVMWLSLLALLVRAG